jgi:hypothetical protein
VLIPMEHVLGWSGEWRRRFDITQDSAILLLESKMRLDYLFVFAPVIPTSSVLFTSDPLVFAVVFTYFHRFDSSSNRSFVTKEHLAEELFKPNGSILATKIGQLSDIDRKGAF